MPKLEPATQFATTETIIIGRKRIVNKRRRNLQLRNRVLTLRD